MFEISADKLQNEKLSGSRMNSLFQTYYEIADLYDFLIRHEKSLTEMYFVPLASYFTFVIVYFNFSIFFRM